MGQEELSANEQRVILFLLRNSSVSCEELRIKVLPWREQLESCLASLVEKGLIGRHGGTVWLTAEGEKVGRKLPKLPLHPIRIVR